MPYKTCLEVGGIVVNTGVFAVKLYRTIFLYVFVILSLNACLWGDPYSAKKDLSKSTIRTTVGNRNLFLAVNEERAFDFTITAENLHNYAVRWTSSDPSKVTVDQNGKVKGIASTVKPVAVTVTVTSAGTVLYSSDISAPLNVTVQTRLTQKASDYHVVFKENENTTTVNRSGLQNRSVYLVKLNRSGNLVDHVDTGSIRSALLEPGQNRLLESFESGELFEQDDLPMADHPSARDFNANPPPIDFAPSAARSARSFVPPTVGNTRMFWVEKYFSSHDWVEKQAVLMATGQHGNIWVMDNRLSKEQAQKLSDTFDIIYPAATNILGYEYGGGPGGNGGRDGDPKIQILVYDILDASGKESGVAGYFWGKDFYEQSTLNQQSNKLRTNLAEIFYVSAGTVIRNPNFAYSVLVHELQHMINFNMKWVKHKISSETWYDELLSAMTQDLIDTSFLGISLGNPHNNITERMPRYLRYYNQIGITEWNGSLNSYATAVAFGAYLLRNYGGADLVKSILANHRTGIESLSMALYEISPGTDFEKALLHFGEAMIFSGASKPSGVNSFDKTVTSSINGLPYTAYGFNLRDHFGAPTTFPMDKSTSMRPHSVILYDASSGKNKSGDVSITLEKPNHPGIEFFLMER